MKHFESLDTRVLMAASASIDSSTLTLKIFGTGSADVISMTKSGTNAKVVLNGVTKYFLLSKFNTVDARLYAGSDTFTMTNDIVKAAYIEGGDGNDKLVGGGQNDYITGGNNNDTMDGAAGNDILFGNAGTDTADFSNRTYNLIITLDDNPNDGGVGGQDNIHSDIENVWGGSKDDKITGSSKNNKLVGNAGNDSLVGLGGNDSLYGNDGKDTLIGNTGNDQAYGGNQDDWIDISDGIFGNDSAYGDAGNDTCFRDKSVGPKDTTVSCEVLFG